MAGEASGYHTRFPGGCGHVDQGAIAQGIGETATASGWHVTGHNGENPIQAQGASQAEAWH